MYILSKYCENDIMLVCVTIYHGILFPEHTPVSYNKYYVSIKNSSTYPNHYIPYLNTLSPCVTSGYRGNAPLGNFCIISTGCHLSKCVDCHSNIVIQILWNPGCISLAFIRVRNCKKI